MRTTQAAALLLLALMVPLAAAGAQGQKHALLIGIGDYTYAVPDLEGPPYDLQALQRSLTERWGFPAGNVKVLLNGQATRANILGAIDALARTTKPKDFLFVYFSGHGTSGFERSDLGIDGYSGAIVPADFDLESSDPRAGLIVGSRDLRPRLQTLDRDREVFVVFDSCYSGAAVRSLRAIGKPRFVQLPAKPSTRAASADAEPGSAGAEAAMAPPYPYQNVVYISAASRSEAARDITSADLRAGRAKTVDGAPHGALTNALLEGLGGSANTNRDAVLSYGELYQYVRDTVSQSFPHQPQLLVPAAKEAQLLSEGVLAQPAASVPPPSLPVVAGAAGGALRVKLENVPAALAQKIRAKPGIRLSDGAYDMLVAAEKDGYWLYHASGDVLATYLPSQADEVAERAAREVAVRELTELAFDDQSFNVTVSIPGNRGVLTKGESFAIEWSAEQPAYVLLLNIDNGGHVSVLYPYETSELAPARSGRIADEFRVSPPFGTEYLKIFAFAQKPAGFDRWLKASFSPLGPELSQLLEMIRSAKGGRAQSRLKVVTRESAS